jgi:hypothetical protein
MRYFPAAFARAFLALALALAAAGCVTIEKVDYDKAANARVKKIALLPVEEPLAATVMNIGGAAAGFGLIGGLIQGSMNEANSKRLTEAFDNRKIRFADEMAAALARELRVRGFEVVRLESAPPVLGVDGKTYDYSRVQTDADAILHVKIGVNGYAAGAFSLDYEPWVTVGARLVDARTRRPIYVRVLKGGFGSSSERVEDVGYDLKYRWGSANELMDDVDRVADGLRDVHRRIAERIAQNLG